MGAKRPGKKRPGGNVLGAKRLGAEMVWGRNDPDSLHTSYISGPPRTTAIILKKVNIAKICIRIKCQAIHTMCPEIQGHYSHA